MISHGMCQEIMRLFVPQRTDSRNERRLQRWSLFLWGIKLKLLECVRVVRSAQIFNRRLSELLRHLLLIRPIVAGDLFNGERTAVGEGGEWQAGFISGIFTSAWIFIFHNFR
mgnify:CR=1 FL=1